MKAALRKELRSIWLPKIWRKFPNQEDQKDILQECFVSYLRNQFTIEALNPGERRNYLKTIADSKIADAIRKKVRERENSKRYLEEQKTEEKSYLNYLFEIETPIASIRKQLEMKDDTPFLEYFKPYLTEDQYIAINLLVERYTYKTIAQKMDKTTNQVKGLIERSRKKIRHLIRIHS